MFGNILFFIKSSWILTAEYLKYRWNKKPDTYVNNLIHRLAKENILCVKVFQNASMLNNFLTDEQQNSLLQYIDNVPYNKEDIDYDTLWRLQNDDKIAIEPVPINAGMIALVFKGKLPTGEDVIIKMKRLNIDAVLKRDIQKVTFAINLLSFLPAFKRMDLKNIFDMNVKSIEDQINFSKEIKYNELMYNAFRNIDYIDIPDIHYNYVESYPNVIVMEYLDGIKLHEIEKEDTDMYSQQFAKFTMKSLLFDGVFHGDLHAGNVLFMKNGSEYKIGIIDYGIMCIISREEQHVFYEFAIELTKGNYDKTAEHILKEMMTPDDLMDLLPFEDYNNAHDTLKSFCEDINEGSKELSVYKIYTLNKQLEKYNILMKPIYYDIMLSLAISWSICNNFQSETTYVDHMKNIVKDLLNADILEV